MFKKVMCGVAFVLFLGGCGDKPEIKEVVSQEQKTTQNISKTALYLPGGAGIDFGRNATSERINTNPDGRNIKILSYNFDETAEEVDASLAKVLQPEGYVRTSPAAANVILHSVYTKKGYPYVSARYLDQEVKAPNKKTILVLSWEIKP